MSLESKDNTNKDGSWSEWRRLVLNELNRLNKDIEGIKDAQRNIQIELATQTTKIALYAGLGSTILGTVIAFIIRSIT